MLRGTVGLWGEERKFLCYGFLVDHYIENVKEGLIGGFYLTFPLRVVRAQLHMIKTIIIKQSSYMHINKRGVIVRE